MHSFVQYTPTEIVFGRDAQKKTGKLAAKWGAKKVLIVYGGGSVVRSGLLDTIKEALDREGIEYDELAGVKPNPRVSLAREGVKKAAALGADLILAVGGGSVIDTAKAVAIGAANQDVDIWEFWEGRQKIEKSTPVGVVLTISAAGSEMSDSSVLTNEETGRKCGVSSDLNRPKFAVMNPELTYTIPRYQLSCGIVDIYMHTLERYFTHVSGNRMTDEIAEGLMRTVIEYGRKAYENQTDYDAMSELMWCGSISHNGITGHGRPRDFANHKLGHELSAMFDETHGATLSAVWGSWARYVYKLDIARFAHYGKVVWGIEYENEEEAALAAIEKTEEFFQSLHVAICIGELNTGILPDETLRRLAENATKGDTIRLGCFKELTAQDAYEIYKAANHG